VAVTAGMDIHLIQICTWSPPTLSEQHDDT
jgi:hypothetical protein